MTILAAFAGLFRPHTGSASPVTADCFPWPSVDACGPVQSTETTPKPDGDLRQERDRLRQAVARAKLIGDTQATSSAIEALRPVVTECLRRGL